MQVQNHFPNLNDALFADRCVLEQLRFPDPGRVDVGQVLSRGVHVAAEQVPATFVQVDAPGCVRLLQQV